MFWSKARKIKELKELLRKQDLCLMDRLKVIQIKNMDIAELKEKISSFEKTMATVEDVKHREISALSAERDQIFKKVDELEGLLKIANKFEVVEDPTPLVS